MGVSIDASQVQVATLPLAGLPRGVVPVLWCIDHLLVFCTEYGVLRSDA